MGEEKNTDERKESNSIVVGSPMEIGDHRLWIEGDKPLTGHGVGGVQWHAVHGGFHPFMGPARTMGLGS